MNHDRLTTECDTEGWVFGLLVSRPWRRVRVQRARAHCERCPITKETTIFDALRLLSVRQVRGDLACTQCARVAGTAEGSNTRQSRSIAIRLADPSHADAVRRLCCPYCSARLWLQNSEDVHENWHTLSGDALQVRSTRGPKRPKAPRSS
jgi:uncharacterized protein YbaR (Trm112 family)